MRIFSKTLRDDFVITLIFCIVITASIYFAIQEFAVARHLDFSQFIHNVPEPLRKIAESFLVLNVFGGYLHIVVSVSWIIITGFYICVVSSGLVAKEMENKTLGLLLSHPVSRTRFLAEKYSAQVVCLVALVFFGFLGFYLGTYHGMVQVPYRPYRYIIVCVNGLAFFVCLSAISFFFSTVFNEHKKAAIASVLFFVMSYLTFFLGAFSPKWAVIKKFTLFRFFDTEKLFMQTLFDWGNIRALVVIAVIFFILGILIFRKKDITT